MKRDLRGGWAVVTGASSGLGSDFARELAGRGMNLVLVARRKERLDALAGELGARHGVEVQTLALDLARPEGAAALHAHTQSAGLAVDVLVNNAGFGLYGYDLELSWDGVREMLELDVLTLVQLTRLYAHDMAARGHGYVLNVASIAGTQPSPTFAAYAAAKSFVVSYSHALREELRARGVSVSVLAPGATETEFFAVAKAEEGLYIRLVKMASPRVVRLGVAGMLARRALIVPGVLNRLSVFFTNLLPASWVARIVHLMLRRKQLPA